jgi:bifunctional enzyme CysN/CysC
MSDVRTQACNTTTAPFKELLCVVACGDMDGGKSTLVSRLLYDHRGEPRPEPRPAPQQDVRHDTRHEIRGGQDDALALRAAPRPRQAAVRGRRTVDRVAAAYAQGVSTEVSYRCFSTPMRQFILAEVPDHRSATRNAVAGASTASAAIIVVDVRQPLATATRRHALMLALLGIRQVVLVVNKMDLAGFAQHPFETRAAEFQRFARSLGLGGVTCIPACVLLGDNVSSPSGAMPWYHGPTLRTWLDSIDLDAVPAEPAPAAPPRTAAPAGGPATGPAPFTPPPATAQADGTAPAADRVEATVMWFGDSALLRGRAYWLKCGGRTVGATVTRVVHRIDIDSLDKASATRLSLNEAGLCELALDPPLQLEAEGGLGGAGGSFLLIDRASHRSAGAGRLRRRLRDTTQAAWHPGAVDKAARAAQKHQTPCVVWFTGLPGAGKSTIADLVEQQLFQRGCHTVLLDGANLRHGLNKDLGFSDADRAENIRRIGEMARVMVDAGLIVLVASISPFRAERRMARSLVDAGEFFEVHVDVPLAVAERRDPRGLYRKARNGTIKQFTGIDSAYEPPEHPELHLDTTRLSAEQAADLVVERLIDSGLI